MILQSIGQKLGALILSKKENFPRSVATYICKSQIKYQGRGFGWNREKLFGEVYRKCFIGLRSNREDDEF